MTSWRGSATRMRRCRRARIKRRRHGWQNKMRNTTSGSNPIRQVRSTSWRLGGPIYPTLGTKRWGSDHQALDSRRPSCGTRRRLSRSACIGDAARSYPAGDLSELVIDHDQSSVVVGSQLCLFITASEGTWPRSLLGWRA